MWSLVQLFPSAESKMRSDDREQKMGTVKTTDERNARGKWRTDLGGEGKGLSGKDRETKFTYKRLRI